MLTVRVLGPDTHQDDSISSDGESWIVPDLDRISVESEPSSDAPPWSRSTASSSQPLEDSNSSLVVCFFWLFAFKSPMYTLSSLRPNQVHL